MGNTLPEEGRASPGAVHPHTHGEHPPVYFLSERIEGSSPHAWGTPKSAAAVVVRRRFIPTRMGNTHSRLSSTSDISVHPHTHGEHSLLEVYTPYQVGSSPHAWGTRHKHRDARWVRGFIPTRMGNTYSVDPAHFGNTVHPHTHGEHLNPAEVLLQGRGSSPHAWGTPQPGEVLLDGSRFIPTRMGNTRDDT